MPYLRRLLSTTKTASYAVSVWFSRSTESVMDGIGIDGHENLHPQPEPPMNLSGSHLSSQAEALLLKGPEFAPSITPSRVNQLAAIHQIAPKTSEPAMTSVFRIWLPTGAHTWCVKRPEKPEFPSVIKKLNQAQLKLLEADKTGAFVVRNESTFGDKVEPPLRKNFTYVTERPSGALCLEVKETSADRTTSQRF